MAISKVDIVNKALTLVGANPIVSMDDDTQNARVASRVYEISLRSILSECKWNFATKRALLSSVVKDLAWFESGEQYQYSKPSDSIRIFETSDPNATWREEGDYIISDTAGLGVRYVYYLDTPSKYPSSFVDAFIDKLCSEIAYTIVNSATLGQQYKTIYETVSLQRATSENSMTGKQQSLKDDAWELAKHSNENSDS